MAQPTQYQRVGSTQFDVTEAGVESLGYLSFDGIDDWMVTPTITPGIDKVQVFAGVRKLTDVRGILAELGTGLQDGSFGAQAPQTTGVAGYEFYSKGTVFRATGVGSGYPAPINNILTCTADISGDDITLRIDGAQISQSVGDQGTGVYNNYALTVGRRASGGLHFKGDIYSLITRFGDNLEVAQIESTEAYVAGKTAGVDL